MRTFSLLRASPSFSFAPLRYNKTRVIENEGFGKIKKRVPKKFLGAFNVGHRKNVRELIDHDDFSHELLMKAEAGDPEAAHALEWLAKYNNESFKGFLKKGDKKAIHNTPKLYKEVTRAHNARRRDFLSGYRHEDEAAADFYLNQHPNIHHEDNMIDLVSPKAQRKLDLIKKRKP